MTFALANLFKIGGSNPSLYIHKSADPHTTADDSGYFNLASDWMMKGDVIITVDTNLNTIQILMVSSADKAATVTTAKLDIGA
jgi:hypothetical protein